MFKHCLCPGRLHAAPVSSGNQRHNVSRGWCPATGDVPTLHTPRSTPRNHVFIILCNWLPPFYYLPLLFQVMNFGKTDSVTKSPSSAGCWAYVFSSTASSSVFSSSHLTIYCQFEKASLHLAGCLRLQPYTTLVEVWCPRVWRTAVSHQRNYFIIIWIQGYPKLNYIWLKDLLLWE